MGLLAELLAEAKVIAAAAREWRRTAAKPVLSSVLSHPDADPVLDIEQAAAYAALCPKTLKTDALAGKLAIVQRSEAGRVRVRLSDLNDYLDKQRRAAVAAGKTDIQSINWGL